MYENISKCIRTQLLLTFAYFIPYTRVIYGLSSVQQQAIQCGTHAMNLEMDK